MQGPKFRKESTILLSTFRGFKFLRRRFLSFTLLYPHTETPLPPLLPSEIYVELQVLSVKVPSPVSIPSGRTSLSLWIYPFRKTPLLVSSDFSSSSSPLKIQIQVERGLCTSRVFTWGRNSEIKTEEGCHSDVRRTVSASRFCITGYRGGHLCSLGPFSVVFGSVVERRREKE